MYIHNKEIIIILLMILLVAAIVFVRLWKSKGLKSIFFLIIFLLIIRIVSFTFGNRPIKYAIKEDEFSQYSNYILVQEVHYTGTGWTMVGDETGYFPNGQVKDIVLSGEKLPEAEMPDNYNTFLCIVEYQGLVDHGAFEGQVDSYEIIDWYPVYPIVRNRILPQSFYPQNYMTKYDMRKY